MIDRFLRWMFGIQPTPARTICDLCAGGHHVHDVNTGRCIYVGKGCACWKVS